MNKKNLDGILYFIAGILFFVAAMREDNFSFYALVFCFIVLGINNKKKIRDTKFQFK